MKSALVVAAGSGGVMAASHYLIERILGRELHVLERYVVGVLFGIILPFAAWTAITHRERHGVAALFVISAGAGAGTCAAHLADRVAGERAKGWATNSAT